jgi:hypothetical protein
VWRGAAVAVLCSVLTAVGHVAGGGTLPDLSILLILLPMLATVSVSTAGACRSAVGSVASLAVGQIALHEAMTLLHPMQERGPALLGSCEMFVMHAAVTLVTALALRHADAAVSALAEHIARVLPRRLAPPPAQRPLRACPVPATDVPTRLALALATTAPRRGPPVSC